MSRPAAHSRGVSIQLNNVAQHFIPSVHFANGSIDSVHHLIPAPFLEEQLETERARWAVFRVKKILKWWEGGTIDVPHPGEIIKRLRVKDVWPSTPCIATARCPDCERAKTASPPDKIQCPRRVLYRRICNGVLKDLVAATQLIVVHIQYSKTYQIWCTSPEGQPEGSRWCNCKVWHACHPGEDASFRTEDPAQACICLSCLRKVVKQVDALVCHMDQVNTVWSLVEPLRVHQHEHENPSTSEISALICSDSGIDFWASVYTEDGSLDVSSRTDEKDVTYCSSTVLSKAATRLDDFQNEQRSETQARVSLALSRYMEYVNSGCERESGASVEKPAGRYPVEKGRRRSFSRFVRKRASSVLSQITGNEVGDHITLNEGGDKSITISRPDKTSIVSPSASNMSGIQGRARSLSSAK